MSGSRSGSLAGTLPRTGHFDYHEAFSRNLGLVTDVEQERLRRATVGIPGMGGVGGIHLVTLARMGIGGFRVADADRFETANRNRQFGSFESTTNEAKVDVMARFARDINPEVRLEVFPEFLTETSMDTFVSGCDVIIDSLDAFALDARLALFRAARRRGIPVISAGPIGFSTAMLVMTRTSMDLDTYLDIEPGTPATEAFYRFLIGLTPAPKFLGYMRRVNIEDRRGPSIASAVTLCAGFAATEALKLLLGRGHVHALPGYHYYDPYVGSFRRGRIPFGNRNPWQKLKLWYARRKLTGGATQPPPVRR